MVLLLDEVSNLLPLLPCWVNARGIVRAAVKDNDRPIRGVLRRTDHKQRSRMVLVRSREHQTSPSHGTKGMATQPKSSEMDSKV